MESLNVGSRQRTQIYEEVPAQGSQSTKDWTVAEQVFDSFQLTNAIVWQQTVPDPYQPFTLAVACNEASN